MNSTLVRFAALLSTMVVTGRSQSTLQFSASSYSVAESAGSATLIVQRAGDTNAAVSVDFSTADGTATNGVKYTAASGNLSFAPGETNKTIVVPILDEGFVEGIKYFRVILSNPTAGAVLGLNTNDIVNIDDNDLGVQFQFASYSVSENAGQVLIGVVRGDDGSLPVTVSFATIDLGATNGLDYIGTNSTLAFEAQERLKFVSVPIINNNFKQSNRAFRIALSNPDGATLGSQKTTTVTILDNDQGFQVASTTYSVIEDAGAALVSVLRGTDDTNSTVTVDYATSDGSATNGVDYLGLTNTLSFAPGEKVKLVTIPILNNSLKQLSRNFRLTLSNPSGSAVLGSPTASTITILDNDPGLGFERSLYTSAWDSTNGITLAVLRGNDMALGPITVDYATSDGTAQAGVDYQVTNGTLEFKVNETVKGLTIPILRDRVPGGIKSFSVVLSNVTGGAVLATSFATVRIIGAGFYFMLAPPFETSLTIQSLQGLNTLSWNGGGQLQRADSPAGPWQAFSAAKSPCTVQSPVPGSFYRVALPRPVNVYVPSSYNDQTAAPLVILLHAYSQNGATEESYMQVQPLAEARGFLYCYPDSLIDRWGNPFWNATDSCCDFGSAGVDDAGFLRALIQAIQRQFAVDRKRIYLIGHSNGGFMAYRMACQSADLIAGIASLAGATFLNPSNCAPSEPVNILQIHGTADDIIPYAGGAVTTAPAFSAPCNEPAFPGALGDLQLWAQFNGASGPVTDGSPSIDLTTDVAGLDSVVTRYTNFPAGGAVELWTINGGSHSPSLSVQFPHSVIDWLLAHPKP